MKTKSFRAIIFIVVCGICYYLVAFQMYWTSSNNTGDFIRIYLPFIGILSSIWVYFWGNKYVKWLSLIYFSVMCHFSLVLTMIIYFGFHNISFEDIYSFPRSIYQWLVYCAMAFIFLVIPVILTIVTCSLKKRREKPKGDRKQKER